MKKYFFLVFCSICFSLVGSPITNPAVARTVEKGFIFSGKWFSFRFGYEGDFVSNRRLKQKDADRIDNFSQDYNSGFLVLNLLNRLDVYGVLGQARYKADWIIKPYPPNFNRIELETSYRWRWDIGARAIFLEWGDVTFALGGRYSSTDPNLLWMSIDADTYKPASSFSYEEWQVDAAISYKIDLIIPYISVKYSHADVQLQVPDLTISSFGTDEIGMENRDNYGIALGCGFSNGKYFHLNGEVRLFDEEAFTLSGEFRF